MREIEFRGKRIDNGEWVYGVEWLWNQHYEGKVEQASMLEKEIPQLVATIRVKETEVESWRRVAEKLQGEYNAKKAEIERLRLVMRHAHEALTCFLTLGEHVDVEMIDRAETLLSDAYTELTDELGAGDGE